MQRLALNQLVVGLLKSLLSVVTRHKLYESDVMVGLSRLFHANGLDFSILTKDLHQVVFREALREVLDE